MSDFKQLIISNALSLILLGSMKDLKECPKRDIQRESAGRENGEKASLNLASYRAKIRHGRINSLPLGSIPRIPTEDLDDAKHFSILGDSAILISFLYPRPLNLGGQS
ncbi:hypothetical protein Fcan01_05635 [Folsomia candida]|uniref:Uncharacterized protein n=1 Tax=Folsomia candida TaxID=158441 RepID=A0A226EQC9_FOLCA|nr:hypothetical protein Fcan01_05635 [Folsomia candida]